MRLFIVRHGETNWNVEGRFQGQTDTDLSPTGLAQADALAASLAGHRFDEIATSPLSRAKVTAEKIASRCPHGEFKIAEGLTEIDHGDWEGHRADEVASRWGELLAAWHRAPESVVMPGDGGESIEMVQRRSVACVRELASSYSGDVVVSTHDAVIKVLLCEFLGAPLSSFWRFQIANCGLSIVELGDDRSPRVSLLGDAHHLGMGFTLPEQKGL